MTYYEAQNIFPATGGNGQPYGYSNEVDKQIYRDDPISFPLDSGYSDSGTKKEPTNVVDISATGLPEIPGEAKTSPKSFMSVGAVIGWLVLVAVAFSSTTKK